jgi:uncharacterized protein
LLDGPLTPIRGGLRVAIRLSPRAKSNRLIRVSVAPEGGHVIKASVTAPPQDGQANEALLRLLAGVWRLPRRDLSIAAGAGSRMKFVRIAGDTQQLLAKISEEIANLPGE